MSKIGLYAQKAMAWFTHLGAGLIALYLCYQAFDTANYGYALYCAAVGVVALGTIRASDDVVEKCVTAVFEASVLLLVSGWACFALAGFFGIYNFIVIDHHALFAVSYGVFSVLVLGIWVRFGGGGEPAEFSEEVALSGQ